MGGMTVIIPSATSLDIRLNFSCVSWSFCHSVLPSLSISSAACAAARWLTYPLSRLSCSHTCASCLPPTFHPTPSRSPLFRRLLTCELAYGVLTSLAPTCPLVTPTRLAAVPAMHALTRSPPSAASMAWTSMSSSRAPSTTLPVPTFGTPTTGPSMPTAPNALIPYDLRPLSNFAMSTIISTCPPSCASGARSSSSPSSLPPPPERQKTMLGPPTKTTLLR